MEEKKMNVTAQENAIVEAIVNAGKQASKSKQAEAGKSKSKSRAGKQARKPKESKLFANKSFGEAFTLTRSLFGPSENVVKFFAPVITEAEKRVLNDDYKQTLKARMWGFWNEDTADYTVPQYVWEDKNKCYVWQDTKTDTLCITVKSKHLMRWNEALTVYRADIRMATGADGKLYVQFAGGSEQALQAVALFEKFKKNRKMQ